MEVSPAASE